MDSNTAPGARTMEEITAAKVDWVVCESCGSFYGAEVRWERLRRAGKHLAGKVCGACGSTFRVHIFDTKAEAEAFLVELDRRHTAEDEEALSRAYLRGDQWAVEEMVRRREKVEDYVSPYPWRR